MGFKQGAYAKVWSVEKGASGKFVKARISTSRKGQDGTYEQDFGDFVTMVGTANTKAQSGLKEGDKIKLGGVDVTTRYDKQTKKQYVNYTVFDYEMADQEGIPAAKPAAAVEATPEPDTGLPF